MSQLHAVFRSLLREERSVADVLVDANRMFSEHIPASRYATVVCGRLQADGGLELANAGHLPPLLLRAGLVAGRRVRPLAATGLPLGLFPRASFAAAREPPAGRRTAWSSSPTGSARRWTAAVRITEPSGLRRGLNRSPVPAPPRSPQPASTISATSAPAARCGDDLALLVVRRSA